MWLKELKCCDVKSDFTYFVGSSRFEEPAPGVAVATTAVAFVSPNTSRCLVSFPSANYMYMYRGLLLEHVYARVAG